MLPGTAFLRPRYFRLLLISSLALNALALALPMMTMQIYDRVLTNHAVDTLIVLAIGVLLASVAELILRVCRSMVVGLNGASFEHEAAVMALSRLLETEPRIHGQTAPAILAQDIGAAARLKDYYGGQMMVTLMVDLPFTLVFLALEIWLAHWLALVPIIVLGVFFIVSWKHGKKLRAKMDKRENEDDARYSFITAALQSVHTIKALCLEAPVARHFEAVQRESGPTNYELACQHGHAGTLSYGFAQLMTVAVICAGAPLAVNSSITVGTLIACVLLSGQIMQPLQRGLATWIRFQDIGLAKERMQSLLALTQRPFLKTDQLQAGHGSLKMDQLRFSYSEGQPILDGASLDIAPGEAVAIIGGSGSGKTTLLELIAGIYMPDKGQLQFSGMELSHIPMAERARYVAYLPVNGMILRGSIMDNLTGFNPQLRKEAREVADQLGIEESVALLPSGYDTPLEGHTTDVVPPGLKQRIAIARALLYKPRLILFDNADHGMDQESYTRIFELLAKLRGKATLVLVSEDRNILSLSDYVFELKRGQLVKTMIPASLLADRGSAKRSA